MGVSFKDLIVWQKAIQLSSEIYRLTASFPPSEQFGLINQMRRASVSIASNIAEGNGRSTKGEYVLFLGHARGSNCELQTQLTIADNLGLCSKEKHENGGKALSRNKSHAQLADEQAQKLGAFLFPSSLGPLFPASNQF